MKDLRMLFESHAVLAEVHCDNFYLIKSPADFQLLAVLAKTSFLVGDARVIHWESFQEENFKVV